MSEPRSAARAAVTAAEPVVTLGADGSEGAGTDHGSCVAKEKAGRVKLSGNLYGSWISEALQRRDREVSGNAVLNGSKDCVEASAAAKDVSGDGQDGCRGMTLTGGEIANRLASSIPDERRGFDGSEDCGSDSIGTALAVPSSPFNCVTCGVVVLPARSAGAEEERGAADLKRECGNATSIGDRQIAQMRTS